MASDDHQRAVVLLSGGLDSSTALAWARREMGWECHTVAFDYGQRHRIELEAAANVARFMG
ncbi:MAG TPA: 7-cyano-7-deazaguanine synthase, partial [Hyphomicrobiales bacterium]|nr:7-cyano-7-deazaguanine synthase [Hyphomicrobiales bacterium]